MNVLRVLVSSLAAAAAVGSTPLPPQQAPIQQAPAASAQAAIGSYRIPVHTAESDFGHEYGIWAGARDYKASFHDGMTFIPRLGGDYPHNQPWSWRTTSVRRGERELLAAGEVPNHTSHDYRYEYGFGAFT